MSYVGKLVEIEGLVGDRRRGIVVLESECKVSEYYTHAIKVRMTGATAGAPDEIHLIPNDDGPVECNRSDIKFLT